MNFTPTQEQKDILAAIGEGLRAGGFRMKISARAGAAKTSTLVLSSEAYPVSSLYIAYNKAMADEAREKFGPHVEVRTAHSYAYATHGKKLNRKLERISGPGGTYNNVCGTGSEVARYFKIAPLVVSDNKSVTSAAMGYAVRSTVANFEYSGDREIGIKHVSYSEAEKVFTNPGFDRASYAQRVLKYAKKLWELRIDPESDIQITHDTYLKLWQLSNPKLDNYDIVYVDEFQDMNGCLLAVILAHDGNIIGVGDDHQSIYGWRGSKNAMQLCNWPEYTLTKSFRFGQEIAEIAKDILLDGNGERTLKFFGNEGISTKIVDKAPSEQYTMIFRTNSLMLETALDLILQGKSVNMSLKVGDFKAIMNSVYALSMGNMKGVKHASVVPYTSWAELCQEVAVTKDNELRRVHKLVSDGRYHEIMRVLEDYRPVKNPDVDMRTGHGTKGLEFDHVVLAEDFVNHEVDEDGNWMGFVGQEQNLLYVAATRAKKSLKLNSAVAGVSLFARSVEQCNGGLELNVNSVYHLQGESGKEMLPQLFRELSHTDNALEAQQQMDLMDGDDEYGSATNIDGSLKLTGASVSRYIPGSRPFDWDHATQVEMARMGYVMSDRDKFVEGTPDSDDEHYLNLGDAS